MRNETKSATVIRPHDGLAMKDAHYMPLHRYAFRSGEPAKLLGVKICTPEGSDPRACYHLRWPDGKEDYSPIADRESMGEKVYEII